MQSSFYIHNIHINKIDLLLFLNYFYIILPNIFSQVKHSILFIFLKNKLKIKTNKKVFILENNYKLIY